MAPAVRWTLWAMAGLLLAGASVSQTACQAFRATEMSHPPAAADGTHAIWLHSDIQPRSPAEYRYYETAVADVRRNLYPVELAIIAGDLVHHAHSEPVYGWLSELQRQTAIPRWFTIAGNHEWRSIDLYLERVPTPLRYTVRWGNALILLMSNERAGNRTFLSEETFAWWRQQVAANQELILITVTHGCLGGSGLLASRFERLRIADSARFAAVLREHKVDIWVSGHSHFPGWLPRTHHRNKDLNGTFFIDLGSIRKDRGTAVESRILSFADGSDTATLRYRNHEHERFAGTQIIPLSRCFDSRALPGPDR